MLAEVLTSLVGPFVQTLTQEFFRGRREAVGLTELREQVVQLASQQGRLEADAAAAQSAFRILVELLARGEVFAVRENRLSIAPAGAELGRFELPDYLHGFEIRVGSAASKIKEPPGSGSPSRPPRASQAPTPPGSQAESRLERSLSAFFDGFDEELRNERQGVRPSGADGP